MTDPALPDRDRALVPLAVVLGALSAAWLLLGDPSGLALREFPLDDGWIHQVYLRGLVTDGAPTYNPGVPEAGFSSALWLLAALPGYFFAAASRCSFALGAKLVSGLWGITAAVYLARVTRRLGGGVWAGRAAVAILYLSPGGAFAAASGMEVTLALGCTAAGLDAWLARRRWTAGAWLAAACLARPECAVALAVVAVAEALRPDAGALVPRVAVLLAPAAPGAGLWMLYALQVTGHPLPNTFYVKALRPDLGVNLGVLVRDVALGASPVHAAVVSALALWGLGAARARGGMRDAGVVAAVALAGVAGVAGSRRLVPGVLFYQQRYFLPFGLLLVPLAALGAEAFARWLAARRVPRAEPAVAALLALALAPGMALVRRSYRAHCAEIDAVHTTPAREIAARAPADVVIGAEGAGAIRFFSGHPVLDLMGLNFTALAHAADNHARTCLLVASRPALLALPAEWQGGYAHAFELRTVRVYTREHTAMSRRGEAHTVVLDLARPWPDSAARCAGTPGLPLRGSRSGGGG